MLLCQNINEHVHFQTSSPECQAPARTLRRSTRTVDADRVCHRGGARLRGKPCAGGRLRALAVTSPQRLAALPNVPTMAELGFPDLEIQYWAGVFAPAGTPQPIVRKLERELQRVVGLAEVGERMKSIQVSPAPSGSEDFARIFAADLARWAAVARTANIKPAE
ncbi:MAG: tripartite tricarboxylate transporter substrate-binding protein [Betaproteobacteria bacterium]